jgi:hypothetical protein
LIVNKTGGWSLLLEYWNIGILGMMGSWIGITLIEVGEASACGGLEAKDQEYFTLCLRSFVPQGKLSDTQARRSRTESNVFSVFDAQYSTIPTIHHSNSSKDFAHGRDILP